MKMIDDINIECTTPLFLSKTTELLNHIQSLEYSELKSYLNVQTQLPKLHMINSKI